MSVLGQSRTQRFERYSLVKQHTDRTRPGEFLRKYRRFGQRLRKLVFYLFERRTYKHSQEGQTKKQIKANHTK